MPEAMLSSTHARKGRRGAIASSNAILGEPVPAATFPTVWARQAAQVELEEAEDTIEALRAELQRAKGREEALHRVIRECRWG